MWSLGGSPQALSWGNVRSTQHMWVAYWLQCLFLSDVFEQLRPAV